MFTRFFFALLIGVLFACASAQATVLATVPLSQTVMRGDTLSVDLQISGLGDGTSPSVGVFDIDVMFDPIFLSFGSATYGTGLDVLGLGSLQATSLSVGSVNLFELSFDTVDDLNTLQPVAFTLATLSFTALADGMSALNIYINSLGDAQGTSLPVTVQSGSVVIGSPSTPVPEPGSCILLASGLAGLAAARRRAKAALAQYPSSNQLVASFA